jgi:glyoxylase-like metal-dependent hydrolase (beta-lactamase superfamily II)
VSLLEKSTTITRGRDVADILDTSDGPGVGSRDISAVIWSHNHFDHTGNMSKFPETTDLVVGPGVHASSWPGWPSNPNGIVLDSDITGRKVCEISFDGNTKIGRFDAFDYFGDGSFYLLDAPGHAVGHLCALARTTGTPDDSFIFMGADACHHPGILRPTEYLPLPRSITPLPLAKFAGSMLNSCPGELLEQLTLNRRLDQPFFVVKDSPMLANHATTLESVDKIQELDASDHVLVILAHDRSIRNTIPLFPQTINGWKERGLGVGTKWLFCSDSDFKGAIQALSQMHGDA